MSDDQKVSREVEQKIEKERLANAPRMTKEREALLKTVENFGISANGLSDGELLKKVVEEFSKANSQLAKQMAVNEVDSLKQYVNGWEHNLKNQDLLLRLKNLNMPFYYLHLFRDEDMSLEDIALWKIASESGIHPYPDTQAIFDASKSGFSPPGKPRKRG